MTLSDDHSPWLIEAGNGQHRCWWPGTDEAYAEYHDTEWGRPVTDDRRLFEKICLEGFQAGLSWLTILRKREAFRTAFADFDPATIAGFGEADIERLLSNAEIVRHRGKITATITNAGRYLDLVDEFGSLATYIWGFEPSGQEGTIDPDGPPVPATTPTSTALSKDLKKRGWSFVGPTTVYAFMQAMGLVNDHIEGCAWRPVCDKERTNLVLPVP